ncbi:MAG: hypothetical protein MK116_07860 [Phycisphaerales bacterium]|nr:hypothetical protein [Phycisphaerales bacterium]
MPLEEPVTFVEWRKNSNGSWTQSNATIEQPVLVVTWSFANLPNTDYELGETLSNRRTMQRYVTSQDENNSNATLWFTRHGNVGEYLDGLDVDRSCFNMSVKLDACEQAIAWGVPTVGLPFGFEQTAEGQPYDNVIGAWWKEYMLIGLADRRAFVRPSYNPTVAEATCDWKTRNGVPIWSSHRDQYWYAKHGTPAHAAQQAAINDPSGNPEFQFKAYNTDMSVSTNFRAWMADWQVNSWVPAGPPGACYVSGFPYTAIGLTANWQFAEEGCDLDPAFLSLSEFILKADAPIWWFGRRSAPQYLGTREPGQVSWCDSCWGDVDMTGAVDVGDVLMVMDAWGTDNPCLDFAGGYDHNDCGPYEQMRSVYVNDILWMLDKWGPCNGWPEGLESLRPADCD